MLFFIDSSWFWSGDILSQLCDYGEGSMLPDCSFSHLCRGLGIGNPSTWYRSLNLESLFVKAWSACSGSVARYVNRCILSLC